VSVSLAKRPVIQGLLWVCDDCLFAREGDGTEDPHCEPWNREPDTDVTLGVAYGHDGCEHSPYADDYDEHSESCEMHTFSSRSCDGCGCHLAGTRHAYTWWA